MTPRGAVLMAVTVATVGLVMFALGLRVGHLQAEGDITGNRELREAQIRESELWKGTAQGWQHAAEVWRNNAMDCREARRPRALPRSFALERKNLDDEDVPLEIDSCAGGLRLCADLPRAPR